MRFMQKIFTICTINDVSVGTYVNTQKIRLPFVAVG